MSPQQLMAIRHDLKRVAQEAGRPEGVGPSREDYLERGRLNTHRLIWRTRKPGTRGSWTRVLRVFHFRTPREHREGRDRRPEILADLERVNLAINGDRRRLCTVDQYRERGRYDLGSVCWHLLGHQSHRWTELARRYGFTRERTIARGEITEERLLPDFQAAAEEIGVEPGGITPTRRQMREAAGYSIDRAAHRLGVRWSDLATRAGYRPRPHGMHEGMEHLADDGRDG